MILSMTGFAAVAAELPGCSLTVELRSVNHRYLDLQVRLPDELRSIESAVRDVLAAQLKRGKVDCRIALNRSAPGTTELAINDTGIIPLHFQVNLWATRNGITYLPRTDENTLAHKFRPAAK